MRPTTSIHNRTQSHARDAYTRITRGLYRAYVTAHTAPYMFAYVCVHATSRRIRIYASVCMCQRSQKHVTLTRGTRIFDTGSSHDKLIGDVAPLSFGASLPRSNGADPSEGHVRRGGLPPPSPRAMYPCPDLGVVKSHVGLILLR